VEERFVGGELPRVEGVLADGLISAVTIRPLDFGLHTDTPAREVSAAHRALRAWAAGRFGLVVGGSQVHGARLFRADDARVPEPAGRQAPATIRVANYDGFLASRPGILLTVGVADCVPAFLAAPARGAVALLHAGWRGAAAEIVSRAVAALGSELGVEPAEIRAWWGPAIGPCCYPVGEEVVQALDATAAGREPGAWRHDADGGPARVDLRMALTLQAVAAGVPRDAVSSSTLCTSCDARLHSYRREQGGGGRMLALAGWAEGGR
jgi:YfiH family protein